MYHLNQKDIQPILKQNGEKLYELVGKSQTNHSVAFGDMLPNTEGQLHYHKQIEETYYFLEGAGNIAIDGIKHSVKDGDVYLVNKGERHQVFAETNLKFICVCCPAWYKEDDIEV